MLGATCVPEKQPSVEGAHAMSASFGPSQGQNGEMLSVEEFIRIGRIALRAANAPDNVLTYALE